MLIRHVTLSHLRQAADTCGVRFHYPPIRQGKQVSRTEHAVRTLIGDDHPGTFRLRLKPIGDHRRGWRPSDYTKSGIRRIDAVCWHGHRDFFRTLFKLSPGCIIKTREITYRGSDDFELNYSQSDTNIGSQYIPLNHSDACKCNEGGLE
jgi:hypothetical protein